MRARILAFLAALLTAACSLDTVELVDTENVVVAEVILRTNATRQVAYLHHTFTAAEGDSVPGAVVEVMAQDGRVLRFQRTLLSDCVTERLFRENIGTCYISQQTPPAFTVDPGARYSLRITLADGGVLTGVTTVPAPFSIIHPFPTTCILTPDTQLELMWTLSPTAWVYVAETTISGLPRALAPRGIDTTDENMRLVGLAVSRADTTINFPAEFGVFERGDDERGPVLVALQNGLPPGNVTARVVVAAGDRNYVNWVRGGNFNPSGPVRVPSIRGDGTGVFGSLLPRNLTLLVGTGSPRCQPGPVVASSPDQDQTP